MKTLIKTIVLIAGLLTAYIVWTDYINVESLSSGGQARVMSEFPDKIVYTTDLDEDTGPLKADCSARKGKFNECGTICSATSDICPTICAYTCEIRSQKNTENILTYKSFYYGFTLNYPKGVKVEDSSAKKEVSFSLWGQSQKESEQLNDGIKFNVKILAFTEGDSLQDAANQELLKYLQVATIEIPIQTINLNGQDGVMFSAKKDETVNYYFLPKDAMHYFMISYSVEDPGNLGYRKIADFMLESFMPVSNDKN